MSTLQGVEIPTIPTVTMTVDPGGRLTLAGSIATRDPAETISPFFRALHRAVVADNLKEFKIDLVGLTFVNSSAIRLLVDWVTWVKHEPPASRYKVIIQMDQKVTWQKTSLGVLKTLAPDVVALNAVG
jgi:hypothetical protein